MSAGGVIGRVTDSGKKGLAGCKGWPQQLCLANLSDYGDWLPLQIDR
jgi:hypothetical protein